MANKTGSNKGRKWMSKDGEGRSIMVKPDSFELYLKDGWHFGNDNDSQKSKNKKWYNNGIENHIFNASDIIPDGWVPGMLSHNGTFAKHNYHWYTNGIEEMRVNDLSLVPEGWWQGQSDAHKQLNKEKNQNKSHLQNKIYSPLYKELYDNRDKSIEFLQTTSYSIDELATLFNCSINSIYLWLHKFELIKFIKHDKLVGASNIEKDIVKYIIDTYDVTVIENDRKVLEGKELDIFIPEFNIGIEFNGNFWHSTLMIPDKKYHYDKSLLAQRKGIRLIHIYEYEWIDQIQRKKIECLLNIALHKDSNTKIYARNCEIRKISNKEAKPFNDANHLQGHRNAQVTYGLFYNNKLVQLMSFSKNKKYQWEIIRGCPGSNNTVVGGVSKLFKHFINDYNATEIFSYCDFNKFDGKGYEAIGMHLIGYTGPDKKYIINDKGVNRNPYKRKELDELSDFIIWGAGSKKYLWKSEL